MFVKNKEIFFSEAYKQTVKIYRELHTRGTDLEKPENTFDGKSLKFFLSLSSK